MPLSEATVIRFGASIFIVPYMTSSAPSRVAAIVAKLSTWASSGRTQATGTPERETIADIFAPVRELKSVRSFRSASTATGTRLPPNCRAMRPTLFSYCSRRDLGSIEWMDFHPGGPARNARELANSGPPMSPLGGRAPVGGHPRSGHCDSGFTRHARGRGFLRGLAARTPRDASHEPPFRIRVVGHGSRGSPIPSGELCNGLRLRRGPRDPLRWLRRNHRRERRNVGLRLRRECVDGSRAVGPSGCEAVDGPRVRLGGGPRHPFRRHGRVLDRPQGHMGL